MKEESKIPQDDDYDDEEGDTIKDLDASDGIGALNQHASPINDEMPPEEKSMGHHSLPTGKPKIRNAMMEKYDPAPWNDFYDSMEKLNDAVPIYYAGTKGHVFLCLHGAGHSALSFAALAKIMKPQSTVVSFDFRGHGLHYCENETELS